jgi:hypothetical protein
MMRVFCTPLAAEKKQLVMRGSSSTSIPPFFQAIIVHQSGCDAADHIGTAVEVFLCSCFSEVAVLK